MPKIEYKNPCSPSPCGPNSQCREINEQAVCSCLPNYIGTPPGCRPECVVSSECPLSNACVNQKCIDPCPGTCGLNTKCNVINHSPICSCIPGYSGDPFTRCSPIPRKLQSSCNKTTITDNYSLTLAPPPPSEDIQTDPCIPSPCGPNSQCRDIRGSPSCSCLPNYIGRPPNCRPECVMNSECPSNQACIREKCRDPCPGSCGTGAQCSVINHTPICTCLDGYTGDPFINCYPAPAKSKFTENNTCETCFYKHIYVLVEYEESDPCNPNPCGPNAQCNNGICTCISEYQGDPYTGCRPECVLNTDCTRTKACIRNKCVDPCPGTCAPNAICDVVNHIPMCSCPFGLIGNAFVECRPAPGMLFLKAVDV